MIIMIIVVVLAGAVIRWVRAGEREIKIFRGAPYPPVAVCHRWFCFWLVVRGSTWLGRRGGLGGRVALVRVYGPHRTRFGPC